MPRIRDEYIIRREYLRVIRKKFNLTYQSFGERIGFIYRVYQNYEIGVRHFSDEVKDKLFQAINEEFEIPIYILEEAEAMYQQEVKAKLQEKKENEK